MERMMSRTQLFCDRITHDLKLAKAKERNLPLDEFDVVELLH